MKWLNDGRTRIGIVGIVAAIVLGSGNAKADFTFGEPVNLGPTVNGPDHDQLPSISADGLELYFMSRRAGGVGDWDIWVARRETTNDPWTEPENIGPIVNSSGEDWAPSVSADGLELYFEANRSGGYGGTDILVASRKTIDEPWSIPVNLGPTVNSSSRDGGPSISSDGLELYFKSNRPGGRGYEDIWMSKRLTKEEPWGNPVNLGPTVSGADVDRAPSISADGLLLYFASDRLNGERGWDWDIWMTKRETRDNAWGEPVRLGSGVNTTYNDDAPSISADGLTLYYSDYYYFGGRPGGYGGADLWQAPIIPIVDFNGDGIVDSTDMCIMVDNWGENYPLCDIGPTPLGDGIVDVHDLVVLAEHLFEEVNDPTLVAHWPLDEIEGSLARDSVSGEDAFVMGDPLWLPAGGSVDGALQLDGKDDYVVTGAPPKPEGNSFSVLAWIKDGAPGQVVLSQMGKANWLYADPSAGALMTELTLAGRDGSSLSSEAIITDGSWYRIGFVWDGSYRRLYVDGVIVAEDAHDNLDISVNGLYIGTGNTFSPETFFSGLIDDIRIYNRVVKP